MNQDLQERGISTEAVNRTGFITFELANELYGIELKSVQEIIHVAPNRITPLFRVDDFLIGLVNIRGVIRPVGDLRVILQLNRRFSAPAGGNAEVPAVVIMHDRLELICPVDRVRSVIWPGDEDISDLIATASDQRRRYIRKLIKTNGNPIHILDVEPILNSDIWKRYQAVQ